MLNLYNTLTRRVEEVKPIEPGVVKMYTCGPTVYRDAHIGNLRSYLMADWIRRSLEAKGLEVKHIKNITDVGHMRQEMLERGDDKVIAAELAEVISGGDTDITESLSEADLHKLERVAFMSLVKQTRTLDRMEHMLDTGKPLRN